MPEGETETWNMATETMKRLSALLNLCTESFQNGNMIELHTALNNLKRNLAPFLEDNELKDLNDLFKKLPENWYSSKNSSKVIPEHLKKVYFTLDEIYIFCGRKMKKKGILMPETINKNKAIIGM